MEREKEKWLIARELTDQLVQRKDFHAIQLEDGRYISVKRPTTPGIMYLHLQGKITLGAYMLDLQNLTRQLIFDADNAEQFQQLKQVTRSLRQQAVPSYLETSRRGGHLRLFFDQPVSGRKARGLGLKIIKDV